MKLDLKTLDKALTQYEKNGCLSHIALMRMFKITRKAADDLKTAVERVIQSKKANEKYLVRND